MKRNTPSCPTMGFKLPRILPSRRSDLRAIRSSAASSSLRYESKAHLEPIKGTWTQTSRSNMDMESCAERALRF
jgi:hypothetical protein